VNIDIAIGAGVALESPLFYPRIYGVFAKNNKKGINKIISEELDVLSRRFDEIEIQEACQVRNAMKSRNLAVTLIDDGGKLDKTKLVKAIEVIEGELYSLGPDRAVDAERDEHILRVLKLLRDEKKFDVLLKRIGKPYSNKLAEEIIRDTVHLPLKMMITDAHARRAALSAWLCYLRQNVGSCFATAPAIIIQKEQPERFLDDINELLSLGSLKRTFGGVEHSVPLAASWGVGDLKKPFIVSKTEEKILTPIWNSPGITAALEAANISREKHTDLISQAIRSLAPEQGTYVMNADDLMGQVLLDSLGLTKDDIKEYGKTTERLSRMSVLMQGAGQTSVKRKEDLFGILYAKAKKAFKLLTENPLLKSWEFSLASFCDTKTDFSRWNLYSSLGMEEDKPHGIGECIYRKAKEKLEEVNREAHEYHEKYDLLFPHVKLLETRIKRASSEEESRWIRAEYQRSSSELNIYAQERDRAWHKGKTIAELLSFMVGWYVNKFPEYFQEVYDADMLDIKTAPYDDSPAGFRLLYKFGRSAISTWSMIYNEVEFVDALSAFFTSTEPEIVSTEGLGSLERDISEIVTDIVMKVKTQDFLETAFHRMAIAHGVPPIKEPLKYIDRIEKKPWAYTSGGTMNTLVNCYYQLDHDPEEESKWVENESELFVFFLECMRAMPHNLSKTYEKDPDRSMLIHSPTHAFVFKPGTSPFRDGWVDNEIYPYSWVRDFIVIPRRNFISEIRLNNDVMEKLIAELVKKALPDYHHNMRRAFASLPAVMTCMEFREYVLETLAKDRAICRALLSEDVDGAMYSLLPIFPGYKLEDNIKKIFETMKDIDVHRIIDIYNKVAHEYISSSFVTAEELQNVCKSLLLLLTGSARAPRNYHKEISDAARKCGLAMHEPVIFADSNWVKDYFGFVVNPGTEQLELWRVDSIGRNGAPMASWKKWVDGSRKSPNWGIYKVPYEYGL